MHSGQSLPFAQSTSFAQLFQQETWDAALTAIGAKLPQVVTGVLLVVAFWLGAKIIKGVINRFGKRRHVNEDAVGILADAAKWATLTIGVITGLGTIGIDISGLVAGLGLTGLALGIALKDMVSNSIAGIMILIYKPFQRHDKISVTALEGVVSQIDLRYTTIETPDRRILIPNANLLTNSIIVYRQSPSPLQGETD